jgi:hypothetical protein
MKTSFSPDKNSRTDKVKEHWNDTETLYNDFDSYNQNANAPVQAKLEVGDQNSPQEKEANSVANFLSGNSIDIPTINQNNSTSGGTVLRQVDASASNAGEGSENKTSGEGQPMPENVKGMLESLLNVDLSSVRIHVNDASDQMAKSINAQAFTQGQNIYFQKDKYNPDSEEGKNLLYHEGAHAGVHQNGTPEDKIQMSPSGQIETTENLDIDLTQEDIDMSSADKLKWVKRKAKKIYMPVLGFPIRYYMKPEKALKALILLKLVARDDQKNGTNDLKEFMEDYSDRYYTVIDSLPADVYEAGNFGFAEGLDDDDRKDVVDLLMKEDTWKDINMAYMLISMLYQDDGVNIEKDTVDNPKNLITANKAALIDFIKQDSVWNDELKEDDVYASLAMLILAGLGITDAEPIVKEKRGKDLISDSLEYKLDDLVFDEPEAIDAEFKKVTIGRAAVGYQKSRKEVYKQAKADIEANQDYDDETKKEKIKELRKEFHDNNKGVLRHMLGMFGGRNEASLSDFNVAKFQESMGDHLSYVKFSNDPGESGTHGKLSYHANIKEGEVNIASDGLPFDSINYAGTDYSFRCGAGTFMGVNANITWPTSKKKKDAKVFEDMPGVIAVSLDEVKMTNIRYATHDKFGEADGKDSSYGIGELVVKCVYLEVHQPLGPVDQLEDGFELIDRLTYIFTNLGMVLTYGILQTLERFSPSEFKEGESTPGQSLVKSLNQEYNDNFEMSIDIESADIKNFISTADEGYIDSIHFGATHLGVGTADSNYSEKISQLEAEISELKNKSNRTDPDENRLKSLEAELARYQGAFEAKTLEENIVKYSKEYNLLKSKSKLLMDKRDRDRLEELEEMFKILEWKKELAELLEKPLKKRQKKKNAERIEFLTTELNKFYSYKEFEMNMTVSDFSMQDAGYVPYLINQVDNYGAGELGETTAQSIGFSTIFSGQGVRDTSLDLKEFKIEYFQLENINIDDKSKSIQGAGPVYLENVHGTLKIEFQDKNYVDEKANKDQGLIKAINLEYISFGKISVRNLVVILKGDEEEGSTPKKLIFPEEDLSIERLKAYNIRWDAVTDENGKAVLKPSILDNSLPDAGIELNMEDEQLENGLVIPQGFSYQNFSDDLANNPDVIMQLVSMGVTAKAFKADVLTDGTIAWDFQKIMGQFRLSGDPKNEDGTSTGTSYDTVVDLHSESLKGTKKDNVISLTNPDIPKVQFSQICYHSKDMYIQTPEANGFVTLDNIKVNGWADIALTTKDDDPRPFEYISISQLTVGHLEANGLEVYSSLSKGEKLADEPNTTNSKYIIIPEGKGASINNLVFNEFVIWNVLDQSDPEGKKYNTYVEGEISYGDKKQDTPGIDIGKVEMGKANSATDYISNSLNYLHSDTGTITFETIQGEEIDKNGDVYHQKTSFDINDLWGEGTAKKYDKESGEYIEVKDYLIGLENLTGYWEEGLLKIDNLHFEHFDVGSLKYFTPNLAITNTLTGDEGIDEIAIFGLRANAAIKFGDDGSIEYINISKFSIEQIAGVQLKIIIGKRDDDENPPTIIEFPKDEAAIISNILLADFNLTPKSGGKWDLGEGAHAELGSMLLPKGIQSTVNWEITNRTQQITSDLISFDYRKNGFDYQINNLLGSVFHTSPDGEQNFEGDEENYTAPAINMFNFGIDITKFDGSVDFGEDERGWKTLMLSGSEIDIHEMWLTQMHFRTEGGDVELAIHESAQKETLLFDVKGDFTITIFTPPQEEIDAAKKDEGYDLKPEIKIHFGTFSIAKVEAMGLYFKHSTSETNEQGTITNTKSFAVQLPPDELTVFNELVLTDFDLDFVQEVNDDGVVVSKVNKQGKATLGTDDNKAIDINNIQIKIKDHLKSKEFAGSLNVGKIEFLQGWPLDVSMYPDNEDYKLTVKDFDAEHGDILSLLTGNMGENQAYMEKDFGDLSTGLTAKLSDGSGATTFEGTEKTALTFDELVLETKNKELFASVVNPYLPEIIITTGGKKFAVAGTVNGTLTLREGNYFTDDEDDAWIIESKDGETLELTDVVFKYAGDGSKKEEKEDLSQDQRDENYEKALELYGFLDEANGALDILFFDHSARIDVKDGNINLVEFKNTIADLMHDLLDEFLVWGPWAKNFFMNVDVMASLEFWEEGYHELIDELDDLENDGSSGSYSDHNESYNVGQGEKFFADWLKHDISSMKFNQDLHGVNLSTNTILDKEAPFDERVYIAYGGVTTTNQVINDALNDENLSTEMTTGDIALKNLIAYQSGPIKQDPPENPINEFSYAWNSATVAAMETPEDLFEALMDVSIFWDLDVIPNAERIGGAIKMWAAHKFKLWLATGFEYHLNLSDLNLSHDTISEKIGEISDNMSLEFDEEGGTLTDINILSKYGKFDNEGSSQFIPAFTFKKMDPENGNHIAVEITKGMTLDPILLDALDEDYDVVAGDRKITMEGLKIAYGKGKKKK